MIHIWLLILLLIYICFIIASIKEVMFQPGFVCLSVFLSNITQKAIHFFKIFKKCELWDKSKWLDFAHTACHYFTCPPCGRGLQSRSAFYLCRTDFMIFCMTVFAHGYRNMWGIFINPSFYLAIHLSISQYKCILLVFI